MDTAKEEQELENRTAGVKALHSMLAATTSGRAKELVNWGLNDRNGMIAFGRIRLRFGKTAGVAKLSDVFQFQWTSPDSLEDKWLSWQMLMRHVNMTSLGDGARETLTIAGLEKAKERSLEQHLRLRAPQTFSTCERRWTRAVSPRQWTLVLWCQRVHAVAKLDMRKRGVDSAMRSAAIVARLDISERCADNVRNLLASQSSSGNISGKGGMSRASTDKCYCCGQVGHRPPDCPRRNENCTLCGKRGHLSHVCRSSCGNARARAVEAEPAEPEEEREIQHCQ